MPKAAEKYFVVDPWSIIEEGFKPEQSEVSEAVFSLANEYMGIRGYFDEGYSGDSLIGSYINGIYETEVVGSVHYKGVSNQINFMVNTLNWLYTRIYLNGEQLDLASCNFSEYKRELNLRNGLLKRGFIWQTRTGKSIKIIFKRFLSMATPELGYQQIILKPLNFSGNLEVISGLDFNPVHRSSGKNYWDCLRKGESHGITAILATTKNSGIKIFSGFKVDYNGQIKEEEMVEKDKFIGKKYTLYMSEQQETIFSKKVVNYRDEKTDNIDLFWTTGVEKTVEICKQSYTQALNKQVDYWENVWEENDISIKGDPENQQGIRYCIFQLYQTFHGADPGLNIGAKGLTGEVYSGHTFWDTETYCLPFYLFNNPVAARNLLLFRYKGLDKARERARELDCSGACYPVATLDGSESCTLWQHASLQFQPSTGVVYGIWHYFKLTADKEFLYRKGIEMLVEISRFLTDRAQRGQQSGKLGYYGVMGPDEFQMMVNHNCYTNFMAKKTFIFTVEVLDKMKKEVPDLYQSISAKLKLTAEEKANWEEMGREIYLPHDPDTGIYEQHDGFFDLPHIDINEIPEAEFPLYHHWSYDRIYRNDMIKQPDVLMFLFLYNQEFSRETKQVNYDYYEPRCIHESSLSPSIHSILASELGQKKQAHDFFKFSTRLDLDNYNRNTAEGLHLTSIAAAWMNVVYGFGGMRSDGDLLLFNPSIPEQWEEFSFKVVYQDSIIQVTINNERSEFKIFKGTKQRLRVYNKEYEIDEKGVVIKIPE